VGGVAVRAMGKDLGSGNGSSRDIFEIGDAIYLLFIILCILDRRCVESFRIRWEIVGCEDAVSLGQLRTV
jgi:hypothetical protein